MKSGWLLLIVLLGSASMAWPNTVFDLICVKAYHDLYPELKMSERELLASFDPTTFKDSTVTFLDGEQLYVFAAKDSRGVEYVFRLGVYKQNIPMEAFAAQFYRKMGVATPEIRKLTKGEKEALAPLLKQAEAAKPDMAISVALRHPASGGLEQLTKLNAFGPYREILLMMSTPSSFQGLDGRKERRNWLQYIEKNRSPEDIQVLWQDLRALSPTFGDEWGGTIEQKIRSYIVYGEGPELAGLAKTSLERVPEKMLQEIADGWALSYALGGGDMNPGNWLAYQNSAFPIDLATPGRAFRKGSTEFDGPRSQMQYPIPRELLPEDPNLFFAKRMSPELKAKFQALTLGEVNQIARESGLRPTPEKMNGVILRVSELLRMAI